MATITQAPARNSTTVRAPHRRDGDRLRTAFRLLESLAPTIGARWAGHLWFTIPETPRQPRRRDDLPLGELVQVSVHGRRVVAETWGSGPAVYLVHGWGGWRTQLGGFVAPLVAAGYRVVAVDAPGHGDSEAGRHGSRQGSFVEFVDAWAATEYRLGPAQAVVAHSGGASAVALALRAGLTPQRLVFIAPMADPMDYLEVFSRRLGIGPRIQQRLVPRLVRRAGVPMSTSTSRHFPRSFRHRRCWSSTTGTTRKPPGPAVLRSRRLGPRRTWSRRPASGTGASCGTRMSCAAQQPS